MLQAEVMGRVASCKGNDTPEARLSLADELYDKIYDDFRWGSTVDLIDNGNGEYAIYLEDGDTQETYSITFKESEV